VGLLADDPLDDANLLALAAARVFRGLQPADQSIADAFLRVDRAGEHLADLEARIETFAREQKDNIAVDVHPQLGFRVRHEGEGPPRYWSVLIGEVIYNLRAALDYLIYSLAWLDSGVHQTDTQFLIEDRRQGFKRHCRSRLKGLSDKHVAAIKRLQPFDGCEWTRTLRDFSNQDKHWALNLTTAMGAGTVEFDPPIRKADARLVAEGKVKMEHTGSVGVTFADETPVLETLKVLESEVRAVLEAFEPEIKRVGTRLQRMILNTRIRAYRRMGHS
jgi:hypothetical protein